MPPVATRYWLMIAALGFIWGGTFLVAELALRGMTPFWLAFARSIIGGLGLAIIWGFRGFLLFDRESNWGVVVLIALLGNTIPILLITWALTEVASGFAGVAMATIPLMVLPLAHVFVPGERMGPKRVIGTFMGFAGAMLLIGGNAEGDGSFSDWAGRSACLLAALCYASSSILTRRLPPVDSVGLATLQLILGSAVTFVAALAVEGVPVMPDQQTLFWVVLLGLAPTALANLLRVVVIRGAGPVFMTLTNYQVPLWAVALGAVFLSEPLPATLLLAMALIIGGLVLGQLHAMRGLFQRSATSRRP